MHKKIWGLISRYLILLAVAFPNLWIFYFIFTPLTIYPVFFILNLFYDTVLIGNVLVVEGLPIRLIEACIAGSAYYLLLILNLTTPMPLKKRVYSTLFSFSIFLAINILRILFFSILLIKTFSQYSFSLFNTLHLFFWYVISSVIIFLIWLLNIKLFKIKEIPVYTDLKFLYRKTLQKPGYQKSK